MKELKFTLTLPNSIPPTKAGVGWDLSVVKKIKIYKKNGDTVGCENKTSSYLDLEREGDVTLFDTGVIVEPPEGYYTEVIARSSLFKLGYMLANGVGIINADYRSTIKVPLYKIRLDMGVVKNLELPCKCIQLILRKLEVCETKEVIAEGLSSN